MATVDSTLPHSFQSIMQGNTGKVPTLMADNSFVIHQLSDNEIINGAIVFSPMTETQKNTVVSFYNTNKSIAFTYVHPVDGITYTLYFLDPVPMVQVLPDTQPFQYRIVYNVMGTRP